MTTSEATTKLESRVAVLEAQVKRLRHDLEAVIPDTRPWWEHIVGAFADDPDFEKAMSLGREYRESLRPKPTKGAKTVKPRKR